MPRAPSRDRADQRGALARALPSAVWAHSLDGEVLISNGRWQDLTGQPSADTARDGWSRVIHPGDRTRVREAWRRLESGPPDGEMHHVFRSSTRVTGEVRTLAEHARLIVDDDGRKVALVGSTHDITAQARAEAEVQRQAAGDGGARARAAGRGLARDAGRRRAVLHRQVGGDHRPPGGRGALGSGWAGSACTRTTARRSARPGTTASRPVPSGGSSSACCARTARCGTSSSSACRCDSRTPASSSTSA